MNGKKNKKEFQKYILKKKTSRLSIYLENSPTGPTTTLLLKCTRLNVMLFF